MSKTVSFTGHRPKKIFFTHKFENERSKELMKEMLELLEDLIIEENVDTFISGGALGTDQLAFICVNKLKEKYPNIKNILAIPFEKQANAWFDKGDILRYEKIKQLADEVVYVDEVKNYQAKNDAPIGEYSPRKMQLRNIYMVDQSHIVVAVFDGTTGGTKNCVDYAIKKNKRILVLDPQNNFKLKK